MKLRKVITLAGTAVIAAGMMAGCSFSSDSQTEYDAFMTEVEAAYWELDAIKPEQVPASLPLKRWMKSRSRFCGRRQASRLPLQE